MESTSPIPKSILFLSRRNGCNLTGSNMDKEMPSGLIIKNQRPFKKLFTMLGKSLGSEFQIQSELGYCGRGRDKLSNVYLRQGILYRNMS